MAHSFPGGAPQDQNKESKPLSLEWSGVLRAVSGSRSMGSCYVAKASIISRAWKMRQSYCRVLMIACTDRFSFVRHDVLSTAYLMATQLISVMPVAGSPSSPSNVFANWKAEASLRGTYSPVKNFVVHTVPRPLLKDVGLSVSFTHI